MGFGMVRRISKYIIFEKLLKIMCNLRTEPTHDRYPHEQPEKERCKGYEKSLKVRGLLCKRKGSWFSLQNYPTIGKSVSFATAKPTKPKMKRFRKLTHEKSRSSVKLSNMFQVLAGTLTYDKTDDQTSPGSFDAVDSNSELSLSKDPDVEVRHAKSAAEFLDSPIFGAENSSDPVLPHPDLETGKRSRAKTPLVSNDVDMIRDAPNFREAL